MPSTGSKIGSLDLRKKRKRGYAAASSPRSVGGWSATNNTPNQEILGSASTVRARIRQLVRDNPFFARAIQMRSSYVVGDGIKFQSRATRDDGALDQEAIRSIEYVASKWFEKADISGRQHFYDLQSLCEKQHFETGNFLFIKRILTGEESRGRIVPFALQPVEVDYLSGSMMSKSSSGTDIYNGIEYDIYTSKILRYHFYDTSGFNTKTYSVPASDVIHGFEVLRPGQLIGISPVVSGVLTSKVLQQFITSELNAANIASKWIAFVTSNDPGFLQKGFETESGEKIEDFPDGIIEYLDPGEAIDFKTSSRPVNTFVDFTSFILRMLSIATGVPYELLSGDYTGYNYTVLRGSRNDFIDQLKPQKKRLIRQFCEPTMAEFFDIAVLSGALKLPNYFDDPWKYRKANWIPPGMSPIDPLKDSKGAITAIDAGLMSEIEYINSHGRDAEDVLQEIKKYQEMKELYGIGESLSSASTSNQNNPAAVMEQ